MKTKKFIPAFMGMLLAMSSFAPIPTVYAEQTEPSPAVVSAEETPTPYYTYLSAIFASIDAHDGRVIGNGLAVMLTDKSMTLIMEFQRSSNGINWYSAGSSRMNTTGNGSKVLEASTTAYSGYYYRYHFTVQVKDSSGRILETASIDSKTIKV